MRRVSVCVVLCGPLLVAGCSGVTTLHGQDNGSTVTLNAGDSLVVELRGNASTGYAWQRTGSLEETILYPVEEGTYRPDRNVPGSSGTFAFRYLAASGGTTPLGYVYKRSWEAEILDSFSVTVVVR